MAMGDFAIRENGTPSFAICEAPLHMRTARPRIHVVQTWYERLQKRLKEKGLTQRGLAKAVHRSEGAISQYLTGERDPSPEMFAKMCAAVGESADEILGLHPVEEQRATRSELVAIAGYIEAAGRAVGGYVGDEERRVIAEAAAAGVRIRALLERQKGKRRPGKR
jgi:transcriptional regulator with XRE-family HTH domain